MTAEESLDTSKDKFPKDTIVSANDSGAATELDESKAKFIPNGDKDDQEHVVIVKVGATEFNGLTKEELMKYANDPFWVRTRLILFVIFWIGWFAMLVAAIVIIVLAPRCPYRPNLKWYNTDVVYEITPRSFKDTNKDGNGDLKGIQEQFPYLNSIGVKTLWIHSLFDVRYRDSGIGLINHTAINPTYGTEADINAMIKKFKKDGRHLIADFIPFYTDVHHKWFNESRNKQDPMADYYIWIDKATYNTLPTGEKKDYHLDSVRNDYYLAPVDASMPNLNLHNKAVRDELGDILKYWFSRGIAGFHINDLEQALVDVTIAGKTKSQKEQTLEALYEWRKIADGFFDKPGRERLLFSTVTVSDLNDTLVYYGDENQKGLDLVAASNLESISKKSSPAVIRGSIDTVLEGTGEGADRRGWLLGDNIHTRLMTRVNNTDFLKSLMTLQMLLPGTAFCYYGDEIGMTDVPMAGMTDSLQKAHPNHPLVHHYVHRGPMLWNTEKNAGFSEGTPWLPPKTGLVSVASQRAYNNRNPYPPLKAFTDLNQLRSNYSFQWGSFNPLDLNENIISFVRKAEGFHGYLVAINFGDKPDTVRFHKREGSNDVPEKVEVVFHSMRQSHEFKPGVVLNLVKAPITLHSYEAAVFKFL